MPVRNAVWRTVVAGLAALTLASCTTVPQQPALAILDRPATNDDAVPAFVDLSDMAADSVRLAAEDGGFRFYLARPAQDAGFCLIQVADGDEDRWGSACKSDGGPVLTANLLGYGSDAAVVADDADAGDLMAQGYEAVQDNILLRR